MAVAFVVAEVGLVAAELTDDDDPWATILALGVPIVVGFALNRWWAVALSLTPVFMYAIDSDITGELEWLGLVIWIFFNAGCLALGIALRRAAGRIRHVRRSAE